MREIPRPYTDRVYRYLSPFQYFDKEEELTLHGRNNSGLCPTLHQIVGKYRKLCTKVKERLEQAAARVYIILIHVYLSVIGNSFIFIFLSNRCRLG